MPKANKSDKGFSEKFQELEEIVEWFSGDAKDIDESLKKFERGIELSNELRAFLKETENKVEKIKKKFDVE